MSQKIHGIFVYSDQRMKSVVISNESIRIENFNTNAVRDPLLEDSSNDHNYGKLVELYKLPTDDTSKTSVTLYGRLYGPNKNRNRTTFPDPVDHIPLYGGVLAICTENDVVVNLNISFYKDLISNILDEEDLLSDETRSEDDDEPTESDIDFIVNDDDEDEDDDSDDSEYDDN